MIWSKLLETYENCNDIVRVAHVALPLSVGALLDPLGKLLLIQKFEKKEWAEYYVNTLPKNGICSVTMQEDYIPEAYPAKIMDVTDKSKIFVKGCGVGYIASQKIIHTMQYLNWYKVAKNI